MAGLRDVEVSFMWSDAREGFRVYRPRSYGKAYRLVQHLVALTLVFAIGLATAEIARAQDKPIKIVAFGDSLSAGFQLPASAAFPARLEQALKAKGVAATVANAGVSGDTASGGLARVAWSVPDDTNAVILELGANDMLRGIDPKVTRAALDEIMRRLNERGTVVLLAGMRAIPNLGVDFGQGFEAIFTELAAKYDALLYPFFLEGVAADAKLNQRDGIHPSAAGVDVIVNGILPKVEELVARVRARRS
jgi:acyl-CoA thioesterase I